MKFTAQKLAAVIKNRRMHLNYSQEYLAMRLHISQNAYSKIELAQTKISVERLIALCQVLETNVFEVLDPFVAIA